MTLNCRFSLDFDLMVGRTKPAPGGRGNPAGPRSHCPRTLSVSQTLPLLHVLNQFLCVRQVRHLQETGLSRQTASQRFKLEWQGLAHLAGSTPAGSLPSVYDSREKFVHFGLAQPYRARLISRINLCQNVRHNLKAFPWFYASETPIFKKPYERF
jgi:hypothetical protein